MLRCVIFEDEHLLAVNKPAGWNTHAPSPHAGEGIYDWLRGRESRWASLAIIHRLDKETSGIMVFGKTPLANRSLTAQFTGRRVRKKYLLLTDRTAPGQPFTANSTLLRIGEKYASRPGGESAETRFTPGPEGRQQSGLKTVIAEPLTGRTHQIRVHAAENGFPILGDTLYGGTAASRVFLHAAEISFEHPATGLPFSLAAPASFDGEPRQALRAAVIEAEATNAFRLVHGASDAWPGWFVDRLGDFLLSQAETPLAPPQIAELARLGRIHSARGAYHKLLSRQVRQSTVSEASPQLAFGAPAPAQFEIHENGVRYELSFAEGYSIGLFLDQRDNRRRWLTGHIGPDFQLPPGDGHAAPPPKAGGKSPAGQNGACEVLNVFAYTCGFSVCAAKAGARVTSLDLSKKYLDWGRRNFRLNGLDPAEHDFIYGDAFEWLRRLNKKGRKFDAVILDPPTFSKSKANGVFRAEKDYGTLAAAALAMLKPQGVLFASTNAADWSPEDFAACLDSAVLSAKRRITKQLYIPQPPDFPISRTERAYLKTSWMRIS